MSSKVGARIKGYIKNLDTGRIMKFQYNPETFEYSRGATYAELVAPGMSYPDTQYVHGNSRSFPIELFLYDKPSTGVIEKQKEFIEALLPPESNISNYTKPPMALFAYGNFIKKCVVEDFVVKIEEYDSWGTPTMARFTLTLRQVST